MVYFPFWSSPSSDVSKPDGLKDVIPLQTPQYEFVPLQFAFDPGDEWNPVEHATAKTLPRLTWKAAIDADRSLAKRRLLQQYLNLVELQAAPAASSQ